MRSICVHWIARGLWFVAVFTDTLDQNPECRLFACNRIPSFTWFGPTIKETQEDGFSIQEEVVSLVDGDDYVSMTKSVGLGVISFADSFNE